MDKSRDEMKVLRNSAENALSSEKVDIARLSREDIETLVYELKVHQIELEMQNEQLRKTQEALECSHSKFKELYDYAPVGYATLTQEGKIQQCNLTLTQLLGIKRPFLKDRTFALYVIASDQNKFSSLLKKSIQSGLKQSEVIRLYGPKGQSFYANLSTVINDENDQLINITVDDISAIKQAEAALLSSEQKYRELVEGTDNLVVQLNSQGEFTYLNHVAPLVFGPQPKNLLGQKLLDYCHPNNKTANLNTFENWRKNKQLSGQLEHLILNSTGEHHHLLWSFDLHYDKKGQLTHINGIAKDMTKRDELEEQLRQSQKMKAIGQLTGGIAHEFNNLLSPIIGHSSLLLDRTEPHSEFRQSLEQILSASERASSLVKKLLAYGRNSQSQEETLQLDIVINEALELLKKTLPSDIRIIRQFADKLPLMTGRPQELHQVILNLCLNACHAMPEGGNLIFELMATELTEENSATNPYLKLTVTDTGCGIKPDIVNRIFDPFFTTREIGEGSGLGLSVVQGIVDQHKGQIKVITNIGVGSRFEILFPASQSAKLTSQQEPQSEKVCSNGSERVLIVDDEPCNVEIFTEILQSYGYQVDSFNDSEEALAFFESNGNNIDLVLTDFGMPKLNGTHLAAAVKKINPRVAVILMTGYGSIYDEQSCNTESIDKVVYKPIKMQQLNNVVREVLDSL